MAKTRRSISIDPVVDEWFRENLPSVSEFINEMGHELIEMDMIDDTEATLRVRERVLKIHKQALQKEIMELQRQVQVIEEAIDRNERNKDSLWNLRIDTLRNHVRDRK